MPRKRFKKRYLAIPLLMLGIVAVSLIDIDLTTLVGRALFFPDVTQTVNSYVQDEGSIEAYFCPRDDCESVFVEFLESAQESIHCALFEVGLESVQETLVQKSKKMDVNIVQDNNYADGFNESFVRFDAWGLMHNKFCIVDGIKISTGSMNPTNNGVQKNNNNLLLIESDVLAQNYEDEFQELWEGTFKKGEKVKNPAVKIGDVAVSSYFCPDDYCAEKVKEELRNALDSVYFMTFSFTHDGIANVLLLKNLENITIKGVMEARQVTKYSKFRVLQYQIGEENIVKDKNKQNMHHKVFIIDGKTVITGSFNPTSGGDQRNDENILIIENEGIASLFLEEFEMVYGEAVD